MIVLRVHGASASQGFTGHRRDGRTCSQSSLPHSQSQVVELELTTPASSICVLERDRLLLLQPHTDNRCRSRLFLV